MLNQNPSRKSNSWKYITVFPALVAFVFLFQIEVVAQEKETKSESVDLKSFKVEKDLNNISEGKEIYINGKKSNQEELDKLDSKEIEKIDVATISGKKTILVTTKHNNDNKITIKVTDKDTYINNTKSTKEELAQLDDKTSVRSVLKQNLENKPVIVLNGSLNTSLKIEDIDPDKIQSINVLKGHHATMKYGENGKNGIIEIITKEKIGKNEFQSLQGKTVQGFEYKKNKVVNEWKVESQPNTNTPKEINGWKIESEPIKEGIKQDIATTNKIDYNKIVIIVDGKISNSKKFKKLNPDEIVSIKVQKFSDDSQKIKDEAVQKYGKKALNGIIEVETKALFK